MTKGLSLRLRCTSRKAEDTYQLKFTRKKDLPVGMIAVDSVFSPVRKVNFWVEKARVGRATDYDRLVMEIWTDGSVTPKKQSLRLRL